jgi:hypothetical protein
MIDIKLVNNDFSINASRSLALIANSELVKQKVYISLKLEQGSYYYNSDAGMPWNDFISQSIDQKIFIIFLIRYLYEVSGVAKVYKIMTDVNREKRIATVNGVIEDNFKKIFFLSDSTAFQ